MKHRFAKRIAALFVCFMMAITAFSGLALAGNVCGEITGTSEEAKTFTVNTGSRWLARKDVLKLTQTKGTMKIWHLLEKPNSSNEKKMYEQYTVTVEKLDGSKVVKTKTYEWDSSSLKIKLDKDSIYHVTVTSYWAAHKGKYIGGTLFNPYGGVGGITWMPEGWIKHSSWQVSATKGILSCDGE